MNATFFPAAAPDQALIDEADNTASTYARVKLTSDRLMSEAIAQAARMADAMHRLELALALGR